MSYKMKEIKIKPASNGFIVEIGCKIFVIEGVKKLLKELENYIKDPEKVEKMYESKTINKENMLPTVITGDDFIVSESGISYTSS